MHRPVPLENSPAGQDDRHSAASVEISSEFWHSSHREPSAEHRRQPDTPSEHSLHSPDDANSPGLQDDTHSELLLLSRKEEVHWLQLLPLVHWAQLPKHDRHCPLSLYCPAGQLLRQLELSADRT